MSPQANEYTQYDMERRGGNRSAAIRPDFEVDKGRIVHSAAFRRLQGKTQVLGVGSGIFIERDSRILLKLRSWAGACASNSQPRGFDHSPT